MSEKSIVQEARDIQLAMELINLGARLQMLESETQLSRGRLIRLYKELRGSPPPKGMLPFSTDWFMTWEQNIHASMFCNAWQFLLKTGLCSGVDAVIKAYRLYIAGGRLYYLVRRRVVSAAAGGNALSRPALRSPYGERS